MIKKQYQAFALTSSQVAISNIENKIDKRRAYVTILNPGPEEGISVIGVDALKELKKAIEFALDSSID